MNLNKIAKDDHKWRSIALKLCGNKMLADELVHEMYLKLENMDEDPRKLRVAYVSSVLYTTYIDSIKASVKTVDFKDYNIFEEDRVVDVLDDEDIKFLNKAYELDDEDLDILKDAYDYSLRSLASEKNIGLNILFRKLKSCRKHILGDEFEAKYKNKRLKHLR